MEKQLTTNVGKLVFRATRRYVADTLDNLSPKLSDAVGHFLDRPVVEDVIDKYGDTRQGMVDAWLALAHIEPKYGNSEEERVKFIAHRSEHIEQFAKSKGIYLSAEVIDRYFHLLDEKFSAAERKDIATVMSMVSK